MGFDENNMPIWEDVTVYQPDNSDYGKGSEMIHANKSMSISSSDGFVLYSDFTHFSYPWKVGYERPGVIDSYFFVELPSGELRWNPDGVEFKAGVVNKIYVTIKSKNLEVSVVHENISSNWWSGSEDDHKYDVSM